MQALVDVILPVFLLIGAGYAAAVSRVIAAPGIDGLMRYANSIAAPCLLMLAISRIDLGTAWSPDLLISFYVGAFASFAVVATGAVVWLRRPAPDAVAIGFAALFSNTLLLGLPITERAYGSGALTANYILISVHSPLLFGFGITLMEVVLARALELDAAAPLDHRIVLQRLVAADPAGNGFSVDLGPAAAFSIMYFLVILAASWVFYTVMTNMDKEADR